MKHASSAAPTCQLSRFRAAVAQRGKGPGSDSCSRAAALSQGPIAAQQAILVTDSAIGSLRAGALSAASPSCTASNECLSCMCTSPLSSLS